MIWPFQDRTFGVKRSSDWGSFRRQNIAKDCAVCGTRWGLELHHKIPVHVDSTKELEKNNVVTLCRRHHLEWGHLFSWFSHNPDIDLWIISKKERP